MKVKSILFHLSKLAKKTFSRGLLLAFLLNLFPILLKADQNIPIQVRGLFKLKDDYFFSVRNTETYQYKWIKKKQTFGGFTVLNYDSMNSVIEGLYNGEVIKLTISESKLESTKTNDIQANKEPIAYSQAEIEQLTASFREDELSKLPDENDPLYSLFKKAAQNRIVDYRHNLIEQNLKSETNKQAKLSNYKPAIGSKRKINRL